VGSTLDADRGPPVSADIDYTHGQEFYTACLSDAINRHALHRRVPRRDAVVVRHVVSAGVADRTGAGD
jgi:hypothetical protein